MLREQGRHAVRIVDADCGSGALLIEAARHARALGFTAIEGRGIDGSPAMISRARIAAAGLQEPAIGVSFECVDLLTALAAETELPADLVLWSGKMHPDHRVELAAAVAAAGSCVIAAAVLHESGRHAA
ncbi:Methyltransferase domain-containing protein [Sphingomonas guangdongensis]|uniref:Methyltransferase domain-containing protein n=1 Tax=Sphingomonas guangdongensis TaxID=1141890 RepID=A0A285R214_9SPHN|nr:methyltransferase domain-containing protein [Sphingomonas guangdongensis]SOB88150.1 Methyltransferase domain-containing protein [Sphingomonas guangdongensis]